MRGLGYIIWNKIKLPILMLAGALIFGVVGYSLIYPDAPLEKIIFMTGITLSTVGYGDVLNIESNSIAIYFTMVLMIVGMGAVLYSISYVTAFIIEGNLRNIFYVESMKRRAKKMKDHYIICGVGKTGIHVVAEMHETKQDFIVIEMNPERIKAVQEISPNAVIIDADATDDHIFDEVNLKEAKALVATLSNDKDNLYLTLSAKMHNPDLLVVARAFDLGMFDKLKKAGADYVVSPNYIGGMRIASEILRPHVVTFLDKMLRAKDKSIRVEESVIPNDSDYVDKSIKELHFFKKTGVNIMGVASDGQAYDYNPSPDYKFKSGDVILYICNNKQREAINSFFS